MDFCYQIQAYRIVDTDLELINSVLQEFPSHKHAILDAGLRRGMGNKLINNWYIPKLELMQSVVWSIPRVSVTIQWSADITEHAHVDQIKDPMHGSNNNNYDPQICQQLDRLEKCRSFDLAMSLKDSGLQLDTSTGAMDDEPEEGSNPSVSSQPVTDYFTCSLRLASAAPNCQDRFSSTILLGGPGMQGTNEEVSPGTSRC